MLDSTQKINGAEEIGRDVLRVSERNYSLDLLKAVSIVLVVIWHTHLLNSFTFKEGHASVFLSLLINVFYINISLLAVPIFYLVSIYLFYEKQGDQLANFRIRMIRISVLYVFWTCVQFAVYYTTSYIEMNAFPPTPTLDILTVGGPGLLPGSHGSVFYFLFDMLVLSILSYLYLKIGTGRTKDIISGILIACFLIYFEVQNAIDYWTVDNFLIYIPIIDLYHRHKELFLKFRYVYLLVYLIVAVQENWYTSHMTAIYGRVSVCFGAVSLFCFVNANRFEPRKIVQFLSKYSLGIFSLHMFVVFFIMKFFDAQKEWHLEDLILTLSGTGFSLELLPLLTGVLTLLITIALVPVLARTPMKRMLT